MFWEAVKDGLLILTFWETYVATLIYFAIYIIPVMIFAKTMKKNLAIFSFWACLHFLPYMDKKIHNA